MQAWAQNWTSGLWAVALEEGLGEAEVQCRLAEATQTGRPLGADTFIEACEKQCGLSLHKRKPGPKPKVQGCPSQLAVSDAVSASASSELW
jgi:hypothetical protein